MLEAKQKRAKIARRKILLAATKMFEEQGFDNSGTEQIAKEAGVSKGTVFAHFGDKLHLLAEVGQTELTNRLNYLEKHAKPETAVKTPIETLCKGLDEILDYFEKQPEFLRLFVEKSALSKSEEGKGFNEIIHRLHVAIKTIIRKSNDQEQIEKADPELTAVALRAFMLHMAVGRMCGEYQSQKVRKQELRALVKLTIVNTKQSA